MSFAHLWTFGIARNDREKDTRHELGNGLWRDSVHATWLRHALTSLYVTVASELTYAAGRSNAWRVRRELRLMPSKGTSFRCLTWGVDVRCWREMLTWDVDVSVLTWDVDVRCWREMLTWACWREWLTWDVDVRCWREMLMWACWREMLTWDVDVSVLM